MNTQDETVVKNTKDEARAQDFGDFLEYIHRVADALESIAKSMAVKASPRTRRPVRVK